jgi:thioredoxin-like negative regulator of GroEL
VVSRLSNEYEGKLLVAKINKPENPQTAEHYNVEGTPATIFFRAGVEIKRTQGYMSYDKLKAASEEMLTTS